MRWIVGLLVVLAATPAVGQKQAQVMAPQKEQALRESIPPLDNQEIQRKIAEATIYTDAEMPPAMQAQGLRGGQGEQVTHFESIHVTKNGNDFRGLPTNPNREFPWLAPGGTDHSHDIQKTFKGFWLPKQADGSPWPVVIYRARLERSNAVNMPSPMGYRWIFPKGTLFFECLTMEFSDGYQYTWELRVREREIDDWAVDVFRPFPSKEHLAGMIAELRGPDHPLVAQLMQPVSMQRKVLQDVRHPRRAFRESGGDFELPPIPQDLAKELLMKTIFVSALGEEFAADSRTRAVAYAPTTRHRDSIVPPRYLGGYIRTDRIGCANCHNTVLRPADFFEQRDWYERVRGSDGILSWHPVEPSSVGQQNMASVPVRYRDAFLRSGMIEQYDSAKHPNTMYRLTDEYDNPARRVQVNYNRRIVGGR